MRLYKYETHVHTEEVSKCAGISAVEMVHFYKDYGLDGLCITDHFLNGNTTVPADLSWEERVKLFCRGYEKAYAEGQKIDIDVFFGWEYSFRGTDLLTYGLDKDWLLKNPQVMELTINEYCDFVHEQGGFIAHAHPFREAGYIDMIRLLPRKVDAVEVFNVNRDDLANRCAEQYAENFALLKIAGSDNHSGRSAKIGGVSLDRPVKNIADLVKAIKEEKTDIFVDQQDR